ncbi:glycosyltransferase family 4 protein [Altericista sp. CCNU0014]|uniref:glycosyltransferase family 4 protein n=1 Tax=Altericista sp. CCNU0014 TaxID=3082949 RepID=UPI00384B551B
MRKPILTIFYQFNPWRSTIGGIQTLIRSYIKYAPPEFDLRLVGTGVDPKQTLGHWHDSELEGRSLQFMPLFDAQDDNVRKIVPTSVRYTLALRGKNLASDFMHFHRLEPTLMTRHWSGEKTLFIHNDIHQQINNASASKNAILWRRFPNVYFALERNLLEQFQQILSCNSDSIDLYRRQYPQWADRIQLVRNTVDNEVFYPLSSSDKEEQRQRYASQTGLPPNTRFILFAGRLHPQKDPLLLVRAMAALQPLAEQNAPVHLLIAGQGELMESIREEIQTLNLTTSVSLLGAVALRDLAALHRLSSAVVLTSAYEGLPLVVLEALASGTPVVTTNCGETPRFLMPGSGVVCQERAPQAIAAAIHKVLDRPEQFPTQACLDTAGPFAVRTVLGQIYESMYARWMQSAKIFSSPPY